MENKPEFFKEHELLKKNLKIVTFYKAMMLIITAIVIKLFIEIIKSVMLYEHGDSLNGFGMRYLYVFIFLGLYFAFLKMIEREEEEYNEKWKTLFKKHFNV
ncbi:hypothetical protein HXX01_05575 [Candidatus Nomurabacteria bacterium]|nr:hypothetical protein [Candidatus Nomurabacteria bacterium]